MYPIPILSPFLFICLIFKFTAFLIYSFYYVYLCERGQAPYKKIIEKNVCCHNGNDVICMRTKFHLHVCCRWQVWGVKKSLRLFVALHIIRGCRGKTMSYAFWPSFISMSVAVTKFEEKCLKQYVVILETCSCRGNDVIYILTKFHLHECYTYQVWGEVLEAICSHLRNM